MILDRMHFIHLFDTVSQTFSTQILTLSIGRKYLSFHTCFNFVFERVEHFVNYFWFWWYVIQQPITKIFDLLHTLSEEIFCRLQVFCSEIFLFCLTFVATFDHLQGVGCKTGMGSFGIGSSNMLLFCTTNLVASKVFITSAILSL